MWVLKALISTWQMYVIIINLSGTVGTNLWKLQRQSVNSFEGGPQLGEAGRGLVAPGQHLILEAVGEVEHQLTQLAQNQTQRLTGALHQTRGQSLGQIAFLEIGRHNNNTYHNDRYVERLTHTGPKHLHILLMDIFSRFNAYNTHRATSGQWDWRNGFLKEKGFLGRSKITTQASWSVNLIVDLIPGQWDRRNSFVKKRFSGKI